MTASQYNIGDRHVSVEWPEECRFAPFSAALLPFSSHSAESDYTISYNCRLSELDNPVVLNRFMFSEIGSHCEFSAKGEMLQFTMRDAQSGSLLLCMHHRYGTSSVSSTPCRNVSALRFSFWFAYAMLTACDKLTFVHSSVIVYDKRAVMFLGESGTGKSTHSRLWLSNIEGSRLLNDDSPILSVSSGIPQVYGSPWSGKTACYVPLKFPLSAVVRLSQAPYNQIRLLSVPEALGALHPSLPPALVQHDGYADLMFNIVSDTISAVPFFRLECLPNAEAAQLCYHTIFGK